MTNQIALFLAALAAAACASQGPPAAGSDAEAIARAKAAGLICRSMPTPGSHKRTTVCAKPSDWASYEEQQRQMAEALQEESERQARESMSRMNNGMH